MRKVKLQNGFSTVETLMAVVIVGLIITVGWFVYDRQKDKTAAPPPSTSDQNQDDKSDSNASTSESKTKEFSWGGANTTLNYPDNWQITGSKGNVTGLADDSDVIQLISPQLKGGTTKDYFCVEFRLNSQDTYPLARGETIAQLSDGFSLYVRKETYGIKNSARVWVTDNKMLSTITLKNKTLLAQAIYSCNQADVEQTQLSYEQQLQSDEYKQALEILKSAVN